MTISAKTIAAQVMLNLFVSLILVLLMFFAGGFLDGMMYSARRVLETPSVLILTAIQGETKTTHATREEIFLITSLLFYSAAFAAVQVIISAQRGKAPGRRVRER
jgi:hypothetical protein